MIVRGLRKHIQPQLNYLHRWWYRWRCWLLGGSVVLLLWLVGTRFTTAKETDINCLKTVHPLPPTLSQVDQSQGDYLAEIQPTPVGYLVWSHFPVTVYIESPPAETVPTAQQKRLQQWYEAIEQAVTEWHEYLPIQVVRERAEADIQVLRLRPPLEATVDPETGLFELGPAATAQTRYSFYIDDDFDKKVLAHRFVIHVSPNLSPAQTLATARHEIGHGLGIWGHSLDEKDVMYFSQVRYPPTISPRDINTLRQIYQQPTCLGVPLASER